MIEINTVKAILKPKHKHVSGIQDIFTVLYRHVWVYTAVCDCVVVCLWLFSFVVLIWRAIKNKINFIHDYDDVLISDGMCEVM